MLKKLLVLLLLSFCWMTYAYAAQQNMPSSSTLKLPFFSELDIRGPVKVILTGREAKQKVTVMLPASKIPERLDIGVINKTLIIDAHPQQFQARPILVYVQMQQPLKTLYAGGSAEVYATHCGNPRLLVSAKDNARVQLQGENTFYAIQNDSTNTMRIQNVTGEHLIVGGGHSGKIILTGKVDELDVRVRDTALLDACWLRARSVHVQTSEKATAYVSAKEVIYGFAGGDSNIYYKEYPERVVRDTRSSGNLLKMD